ncbi:MAG: hypothetical protein IPN08_08415 [Bacteroidales bacterium]|nr:hypothetical protein [Bacteroidales bacterium]
MKKLLLILSLSVIIQSCFKDNDKPTEFYIKNLCSQSLNTHTCSMVSSQINGNEIKCIDDVIGSGTTLSLRQVDASDDVTAKDIFTTLEIVKSGTMTTKNIFDMNLWIKTTNGDKTEFTLTVDDSFFQ